MQGLGIEGGLERAHLEEQDAERPDVALEAVGLTLNDFWAQLVGGTHHGLGLICGFVEDPRDTEVAELDHVAISQKHVLALQVPVEDLAIVNVLDT